MNSTNIKILSLITGLLSIVTTEALASDRFYLKGGIGANTIRPIKVTDKNLSGKIKLKNTFPLFQVGVGYSWNDRFRSEIMFDHFSNISSRERLNSQDQGLWSVTTKAKISALMINSYVDVLKFDIGSIFAGGGIGIASKKETARNAISRQNSKQSNKFAYKLTTGLDLKSSDKFNAELSYNFYNLGRNNPSQNQGNIIRKRSYMVHNVTLAVRYYL